MVHPNETPRPSESPVDGGLSLPTDLQGFSPRQQHLHRKTFSIALAQLQEEDENSLNLQARLLIREQKDLGVQFTLQALSQLQPPVSEECLTDVEFA
ncbi:MAG: hypothetical protein KDD55_04845, partial [Bdellovibrionales bacterium]|nr:hypothetical protein [Bdellovibrionales bacterium]